MNQIEITQSAQQILEQFHQEMIDSLERQDVQRVAPHIDDEGADRIIIKLQEHSQVRIVGSQG